MVPPFLFGSADNPCSAGGGHVAVYFSDIMACVEGEF